MSGKTVAILQARMSSERLPGKILMDLAGAPMIVRVVERTMRARSLDMIVLATTTDTSDDKVAGLCAQRDWPVFRGSPSDLLDRYYQAAKIHAAETIVRITCDCPLIDPDIIDQVVGVYVENSPVDVVNNGLPPRTFPRGLELEVFSFSALDRAWRADKNPEWREHVTPYLYRHPELFTARGLKNETDHSSVRWTVDTIEDLAAVRKIYESFGHDRFSWKEALALLEKNPAWLDINRNVVQKQVK